MENIGGNAQAGLEYLMTYGWALVLIVTIVAVLWFVIGNPNSNIVFSSSNSTKIIVKAGNVSGSNAEVQLLNATGGMMNNIDIASTGYSNCTINSTGTSGNQMLQLNNGLPLKLNCTAPSNGKGCITINYEDKDSYPKTVKISSNDAPSCSQLFEKYTEEGIMLMYVFDGIWVAQTFTPSISHKLTSIKINGRREGLPGIISVSVKATDGTGQPTGPDLCNNTINGNNLPASPEVWVEISMSNGCNLTAGTKYAIVAVAANGDVNNKLYWDAVAPWMPPWTNGAYSGGLQYVSWDGGISWLSYNNNDQIFEEWGIPS